MKQTGIHPADKLNEVYDYLWSNYHHQMYNDGWLITIEGSRNGKTIYGVANTILPFSHPKTVERAQKHGLIFGIGDFYNKLILIGFDWDKFNENLYFWTVNELGLI